MCDDDFSGSFIPSVSSVAGGLFGGAVDLAIAAAPAVLGILAVTAVVSFILANAVLIGVGLGVVGLATAGLVQFLKRFMVVVHTEAPARAKAASQVAITGYPLPRNLSITAGQRAIEPAAQHIHFHGVSAEDVAAILSRREIRP